MVADDQGRQREGELSALPLIPAKAAIQCLHTNATT